MKDVRVGSLDWTMATIDELTALGYMFTCISIGLRFYTLLDLQ